MGYWDITIADLDRVMDRVESIAKTLHASKHPREAGDLREARGKIKEIRNELVCRQHDVDRSKT